MADRSYAIITLGGVIPSIDDARLLVVALTADGLCPDHDEAREQIAGYLNCADKFAAHFEDEETIGGTFHHVNDFVKATPGLACSTYYDGCAGSYESGYFGIDEEGIEHSSAGDGEEPAIPLSALQSCFDQDEGDSATTHLQRLIREARRAAGKDLPPLTAAPGVLLWLENGDPEGEDAPGTPADLREFATAEQIQSARDLYHREDVNVDDDARVSIADDAVWVQAWVRIPNDEPDEDDIPPAVAFDRDGTITEAVATHYITTQDGTVLPARLAE